MNDNAVSVIHVRSSVLESICQMIESKGRGIKKSTTMLGYKTPRVASLEIPGGFIWCPYIIIELVRGWLVLYKNSVHVCIAVDSLSICTPSSICISKRDHGMSDSYFKPTVMHLLKISIPCKGSVFTSKALLQNNEANMP